MKGWDSRQAMRSIRLFLPKQRFIATMKRSAELQKDRNVPAGRSIDWNQLITEISKIIIIRDLHLPQLGYD